MILQMRKQFLCIMRRTVRWVARMIKRKKLDVDDGGVTFLIG